MRLRTAAAGAATAIFVVGGLNAPAQAAPKTGTSLQYAWTYVQNYPSKRACIDAGQQYEREGWKAYRCSLDGTSFPYELWIAS
ncbi:hypothetical protein [Actinomadura opuntiae]|uniref:hypothetical protein n=1 Tax=Actinomadura sp. OS1-43 TaxID=604315 RepID=UPI00255AAE97|nr:hypothetical protein [Actinomadura sp. OS1-43]MDL4816564.1 hypothetical protein [Actinomadura sp. OS1-43]